MRKTVITFIGMAAAAVAVLSCAKEAVIKDDVIEKAPNTKGVTINVLAGDETTKTVVTDGDIPSVQWTDTDKIGVFEVMDGSIMGYASSENASIDGGKASFKTTLNWEAEGGSSYKYTAVYPEDAIRYDGEHYNILFPWKQELKNGNVSDDSDIMFSTVLDHSGSRVTSDEDVMFSFRRLGTLVRLNLVGITPGETIRNVVIGAPVSLAGSIHFDPVTGTVDPESAFQTLAAPEINLLLGDVVSTGNDVIWFRVMAERDWGEEGDELDFHIITDKGEYKKHISACPTVQFPDGGLTKVGVSLAASKVAPKSVPYFEGFESNNEDWRFFDADGDSMNWSRTNINPHSESYLLTSASYYNNTPLYPDNWAFTPAIQLTEDNYLSFWTVAQNDSWYYEHYAVYITEEVPMEGYLPSAGNLLMPETCFPGGDFLEFAQNGYEHFAIQIPPQYKNKKVYFGFRHFNCSDMFRLNLDDVKVTEGMPALEPVTATASYEDYLGAWSCTSFDFNVTPKEPGASYNISGLAGQGSFTIEATFENGCLLLPEQLLGTDADNTYVLQSLYSEDDYTALHTYGVETPKTIIRAIYNGADNQLDIQHAIGHSSFGIVTYDGISAKIKPAWSIPDALQPPLSTPYDAYLGQWTSGSKVWTIEAKDLGTSYYISGFKGQGENKVEAYYSGGRLVLYEQFVSVDGSFEIALQGSNGYLPNYPDGEAVPILSISYNETDNNLEVSPASGLKYYIFMTYLNKSITTYEYDSFPSILVPYVPSTASYENYIGQWMTPTSDVITISQLVKGESYSISGLVGQGTYPVQAVFSEGQLLLYDQEVYSEDNAVITLQGITNNYSFNYAYQLMFVATFDGNNTLNIASDSYTWYCFLLFIDGELNDNTSLVKIPATLTYVGPSIASAPASPTIEKTAWHEEHPVKLQIQRKFLENTK